MRRERPALIRMIAERAEVWTYSRVNAAGTLMARIDMFRIENDLVAEHWAVQEKVTLQRANANDQWAMGSGPQWRIENGKLVDHWGTCESVRAQRANMNDFLGCGRTHTRDFTR